MRWMRTIRGVSVGVALTSLLAACSGAGGDDDADVPAVVIQAADACEPGSGERTDAVSSAAVIYEGLAISIAPQPLAFGPITGFVLENRDDVVHEFQLIRGTVDDVFVRNEDGSLPDFGEGRIAASFDAIQPGQRCEFFVPLERGTYTVFCNLIVDGVVHAAQGTVAPFVIAGEVDTGGGPPGGVPGGGGGGG